MSGWLSVAIRRESVDQLPSFPFGQVVNTASTTKDLLDLVFHLGIGETLSFAERQDILRLLVGD